MTLVVDGGGTGGCKITPQTQTTFTDGLLKSESGYVRLGEPGIDYATETQITTLQTQISNRIQTTGNSTNNAVVRWNGTGGDSLNDSGIIVSDTNEISGYTAFFKPVLESTYTLLASDTGKILYFMHDDGCVVTCPNGLGIQCSWCATVVAGTVGAVTFEAGSGAGVRSYLSQFSLAGRNAAATLFTVSPGQYLLAGNLG